MVAFSNLTKTSTWALLTIVLGISFCAAAAVVAQEGGWQSGFGQGIHEAYVEKGPGNQIYVSCTAGAARPSTSIGFTLAGDGPPENSMVTLTFDDATPFDVSIGSTGILRSDCHACASTFDAVLAMFKAKQSVHVRFENGLSTTFSLAGASDAIGDECKADFWEIY